MRHRGMQLQRVQAVCHKRSIACKIETNESIAFAYLLYLVASSDLRKQFTKKKQKTKMEKLAA